MSLKCPNLFKLLAVKVSFVLVWGKQREDSEAPVEEDDPLNLGSIAAVALSTVAFMVQDQGESVEVFLES